MLWFIVVVLAIVVVMALGAVILVSASHHQGLLDEEIRIELEVRRAERQLHDIARTGLNAMIDEVRSHHAQALPRE
ncbi:MAG TPA: hypothetical protein VKT78_20485 [Fimbriimonadaceae bacterium]|nr:hypothetical protein [Fimbriimonadaceae bacterium]